MAVTRASESTAVYTVSGMTCGHCVTSVTSEVQKVPGVDRVDVDLAAGRVSVTSSAVVDDASVVAAVQEAGYEVVSTPEPPAASCCGTCH